MDITLKDFIDDLINKYSNQNYKAHGYLTLDVHDLDTAEKEEFAAYLMRANHDYGAAFEWLDPEQVHLFADYLLSSNPEDKQRFLDAIKKQTVLYFEETMQDMIADRVADYITEEMFENNMRPGKDPQTGEQTWSRY